jgi:mono/diheme cytochrome c family protein
MRDKRGAALLRVAAAFVFASVVTFGNARADTDLVKRGDYLVNGILTCGNCHTPKGPAGDIGDKAFSGGLSWDEPPFEVTAPNITPDKETGIGNCNDGRTQGGLAQGHAMACQSR